MTMKKLNFCGLGCKYCKVERIVDIAVICENAGFVIKMRPVWSGCDMATVVDDAELSEVKKFQKISHCIEND